MNRPGTRRLEVETHEPARAMLWMQRQEFTESATHLRHRDPRARLSARTTIRSSSIASIRRGFANASVRPIEPSLEDVFVTLTEQEAARSR